MNGVTHRSAIVLIQSVPHPPNTPTRQQARLRLMCVAVERKEIRQSNLRTTDVMIGETVAVPLSHF